MVGTLDEWSTPAIETQYGQLLGAGYNEVVFDVSGALEVDESGAIALTHLWADCATVACYAGSGPSSGFADDSIQRGILAVRAM